MTASITSKRTEDQVRQAQRMLEDLLRSSMTVGLKRVNPDKKGIQMFLGHGNEIGSEMTDFLIGVLNKYGTPNQYSDEEVESEYVYPDEYKGPRPLDVQILKIGEIFGLDTAKALENAKNLPELPEGAEGWFAIPAIKAVAKKHFSDIDGQPEQYCKVIQFALDKIAESRSFYNYRKGEIDPEHIRLTARTEKMLEQLAESQGNPEILIIPCQLGMRHRGRSTRRARVRFAPDEFGFGSLMGPSVALTHPERFVRSSELDMDLPGDEFSHDGDGDFGGAPFLFSDGEVGFDACYVDGTHRVCGSASAFLSQ